MVVHFDRLKPFLTISDLEEQSTETSTRNLPEDNDYVKQQHPSVITWSLWKMTITRITS